jgi:MFS family permease
MLNIGQGRRDLVIALVGRMVSTFGDGVALVALTLRLQADGAHPYEVGLLLTAGVVPLLLLARPVGRLVDAHDSRRLLVGGGVAEVAATIPLIFLHSVVPIVLLVAVLGAAASVTGATWSALVPRLAGEDHLAAAVSAQQSLTALALVGAPAVGGLLAGAFGSGVPVAVDAATFVVSAVALSLIRRPFNGPLVARRSTTIRQDIVEGLRYVLRHPVLRNISAMMALVNLVSVTAFAQLVLLAKERYAATDSEIGLLFAAGGVGVVLFSLAAGPLRKRWSFGNVALGALMVSGLLTIGLAYAPTFLVAVACWGLSSGLGTMFNINTGSLRQAIVPNHLLGRIITIAMVLAWSANPIGAIGGGFAVERTHDVQLVYAVIGVLTFLIPLYFRLFSPLGHAERYLEMPAGSVQALPAEGA